MSPYFGRYDKVVLKTGLCNTSDKSKFKPAKIVEWLNFITDSKNMVTYLSNHKKKKKKKIWNVIPTKAKFKIRAFSSFIGNLTSSFAENQIGLLYCRAILKYKDKSLKYNKVSFDGIMKFSEDTQSIPESVSQFTQLHRCFTWWLGCLHG